MSQTTQQEQDAIFTGMLKESGMPVTEAEIRAEWEKTIDENEVKISNNSAWSPFWRLITAIATKPVLWLVKLLVRFALPMSFARYATGIWLDFHAWAVDLTRGTAGKAEGYIIFTRAGESTDGDIIIPAGTVIESPSIGGRVYRVITGADAVIPDGAASSAIMAVAEAEGAAYNLGPGYYSILPKSVPGVSSASNGEDWLTTPGRDEESDESLRLAIRNQWAAVGYFHVDAAYRVIISRFAGIRTDYIFFEREAPRGPGTANFYVMLESGIPSEEFVDSITTHLMDDGEHGHGDDMRGFPIPELAVSLSAVVYLPPNTGTEEAASLRQEAENIIRSAFRENQGYTVTKVMPQSRFSISRLDDELHTLLPRIESIEITHSLGEGDIVAGLALPQLASLSVTYDGQPAPGPGPEPSPEHLNFPKVLPLGDSNTAKNYIQGSVVSGEGNGTSVTFTFPGAHTIRVGDSVIPMGMNPELCGRMLEVSAVTSTTITCPVDGFSGTVTASTESPMFVNTYTRSIGTVTRLLAGYKNAAGKLEQPFQMYGFDGVSSSTTTDMLARLDTEVIAWQPDVAFLLGSVNDFGVRHHTPEETLANVQAIYAKLNAAGIKFWLGSIPPVTSADAASVPARKDEIVAANALLKTWAESVGVPFFDFHSALVGSDGWAKSELYTDVLHPNADGHRLMADILANYCRENVVGENTLPVVQEADNLFTNAMFEIEEDIANTKITGKAPKNATVPSNSTIASGTSAVVENAELGVKEWQLDFNWTAAGQFINARFMPGVFNIAPTERMRFDAELGWSFESANDCAIAVSIDAYITRAGEASPIYTSRAIYNTNRVTTNINGDFYGRIDPIYLNPGDVMTIIRAEVYVFGNSASGSGRFVMRQPSAKFKPA